MASLFMVIWTCVMFFGGIGLFVLGCIRLAKKGPVPRRMRGRMALRGQPLDRLSTGEAEQLRRPSVGLETEPTRR